MAFFSVDVGRCCCRVPDLDDDPSDELLLEFAPLWVWVEFLVSSPVFVSFLTSGCLSVVVLGCAWLCLVFSAFSVLFVLVGILVVVRSASDPSVEVVVVVVVLPFFSVDLGCKLLRSSHPSEPSFIMVGRWKILIS